MKTLAFLAFALGACGSDPSYKVGGQQLVVKDSGYVTGDYFCNASGRGQLKVVLVDYFPICGPGNPIDTTRNNALEHNELELIIVTDQVMNAKTAVPVAPVDCELGPGAPATATFRHFAANSTTAVETQAVGGSVFLTQLDMTDNQPAKGSFQLDFGQQGAVAGSFTSYTCN